MEPLAIDLISTVTDIEQDEENFEICERFVLSNLLYHKFLDPDELKVKSSLNGTIQKFKIHAQPEKAGHLDNLLAKYSDGEVWKEHHDQYDLRYRLLSLLLHLADSPVNNVYEPPVHSEEEREAQVDWLALLKEGEDELEPWDEDDTLSDWSDDEGNQEVCLGPNLDLPGEKAQVKGDQRLQEEVSEGDWFQHQVLAAHDWVATQKEGLKPQASPHSVARLTSKVEGQLEAAGGLGLGTQRTTEYQVIREVLWILRYPTNCPLFQLVKGRWKTTSVLSLPSLTAPALASLLEEVLPAINAVHDLRTFINSTQQSEVSQARTVEGYTSALDNYLHDFSQFLFALEEEVAGQDTFISLLGVLAKLRPRFSALAHLKTVHNAAVKHFATSTNWMRAIRLLSVLYNTLVSTSSKELLPTYLELFLRTIKPYFVIIHTWLAEGRLEDWQEEFIFYKRELPEGGVEETEDFWSSVYKQREYKQMLRKENIEPLRLLEGLDSKILSSGKSIEILHRLDRIIRSHAEDRKPADLFTSFLDSLTSQLPREVVEDSKEEEADKTLDPELSDIVANSNCPYLALALQEVFQAAFQGQTAERSQPNLLLPHSRPDPLLPLEPVLKRGLAPNIQDCYSTSCKTLVGLFLKELDLEGVLSRARRVFLLEAGDLMHQFCSNLFSQLEPGVEEQADSASLTLTLQDTLASRYPSWADQFSVELQGNSLEGVTLHLRTQWPLTLVLNQANFATYNSVFQFLAGVKRSLWALQSIRLNRLLEMEEQSDLSSSSLLLQDLSLPLGSKEHRLQLLRSWLLYFTTTVHGYFMSRVVHSTEVELRIKLSKATDLDMILEVHQEYLNRIHDRCFLHPSASMLREAVNLVLLLGVELRDATLSDLPIHTRTLLAWEEKYTRCHTFLASTLQAMTSRRKIPHLEGLTVALLHSCPS